MKWIIWAGTIFIGVNAGAYPEYAVRYNINSCTACHFSPVGGGPRTINGKLFGAHGFAMNKFLEQDYVGGDFRVLYYNPQRTGGSSDGMGVMSGSIAGHLPLDEKKRIHLVIDQNIAGFSQAPYRDTYAMFKFSQDGKPAWLENLLVGRFRAPFGIVTDEHRTYTRIQSATEWYTFETGLLLSGESPEQQLHYDVALVNGENSEGQTLHTGDADRWGTIINLRYMPGAAMVGASFSYHQPEPATEARTAASLYSIISLARLTDNHVPLTVELEGSEAWNWGQNLGHGFASDTDYVTAVSSTESLGWLALLTWQISDHFSWIYKFDYLTPDENFFADYYERNGFGLRWFVGANTMLQLRTEFARATPPSEAGSTATGAQNATYGVLQVAF